jgi:RNA polymerase subunit RPABC4/transcription elongation factor Spt4
MDVTCQRCHQPLPESGCFCPTCGLPQLVYTAEEGETLVEAERQVVAQRDASSVDWKKALVYAAAFGLPAGLLCNGTSRMSLLGSFWMVVAAAWAVALYVRRNKSMRLTTGAGARIGLVTGLLAAWLAFAVAGGVLFTERYVMQRGSAIDAEWQNRIAMTQQYSSQFAAQMGVTDQAQIAVQQKWMLSVWGHAGVEAFGFAFNSFFLLLFAVIGGALGARMMGRRQNVSLS